VRLNAANGFDAMAWRKDTRVFIRFGWQKYTATAEEARDLARQLIEAADDLEARHG
jgi:hypothetical protein